MARKEKKRCADCEHWEYTKNSFGYCRANSPSPTVMEGLVGKDDSENTEFVMVLPSMGRNDWCNKDFEPARELESV